MELFLPWVDHRSLPYRGVALVAQHEDDALQPKPLPFLDKRGAVGSAGNPEAAPHIPGTSEAWPHAMCARLEWLAFDERSRRRGSARWELRWIDTAGKTSSRVAIAICKAQQLPNLCCRFDNP